TTPTVIAAICSCWAPTPAGTALTSTLPCARSTSARKRKSPGTRRSRSTTSVGRPFPDGGALQHGSRRSGRLPRSRELFDDESVIVHLAYLSLQEHLPGPAREVESRKRHVA